MGDNSRKMISLEHWQATSLELSKRLKELGVKQDSLFWWVNHIKSGTNYYIWDLFYLKDEADLVNEHISAFTVAELGIALPRSIRSYRDVNAKEEFWVCKIPFQKTEYADTEANARAQMRIWLIENKLVEAK